MKWFLFLLSTIFVQGILGYHVEREYAWRNVTFEGVNPSSYNVLHSIPTGFAYDAETQKLFVAVPRRYPQVPHTLTEIERKKHPERSPPLSKFSGKSSKDLISIYQPVIDECRRLWVVDVGMVDYKEGQPKYRKQNPAIIAFDLTKENYPEVDRYELPAEVVKNPLSFGCFAVDVINPKGGCSDTFLYITNYEENTIVVYDKKNKASWKVSHDSFKPEKDVNIVLDGGKKYSYKVGIFGITLGDREATGNRMAYYLAGSSTKLYKVSTGALKKKGARFDPIRIGDRGPYTEAITLVYDPKTKVIFFAESITRQVSCWNTQTPLDSNHTDVIYSDARFLFGTDISVDSNSTLWVMANGHPPVDDPDIVNNEFYKPQIRLLYVDTRKSIRRTRCDVNGNKP
uniref:Yellow-related salivary protein SP04 n=1 Tax=Phlebotomus argentipes TaxID=94469 RepID=SP04_PHLAR|nr:43 kDa salivary yellow-related protein SP04 [Phlebotomus argentipes]